MHDYDDYDAGKKYFADFLKVKAKFLTLLYKDLMQ